MSVDVATRSVPVYPGGFFGVIGELRRDALGTYLRASRMADVVRFDIGPPGLRAHAYGVFSAEGAQQVLAHQSATFRKDNPFYQVLRELLGDGLLTSQDDEYLRQRRLIQPLFTRKRVGQYATAMAEEVVAMLERWSSAPEGVVELAGESTRLTLQVVARILFGADVEEAVSVIRHRFPMASEIAVKRGFAPFRVPQSWPTPGNRRTSGVQRDLYQICDEIIEKRKAGVIEAGDDLLSALLEARDEDGDRLQGREVRDQVLIFLLAGHETTAISLTFALHLLAMHPDVQARAREEAERVLGGRLPTAEDMDALPYTTMVLKEAMRLFPAAPATGRRSVDDAEIEGCLIPGGSDIFVAPWATHRNPAYWPDPERFDPERFTPEQEASRPRYAWYPFGGGPRACIGQYFSMLESVLALALVLQSYELEAVDTEIPVQAGITLRPTGPVRCRLVRRPVD
jgi:cytochrome P450